MSEILGIYTAIASMKVGDIKSRDIDEVKLSIRDKDLPMRMLLPSTSGDMEFIVGIGSLQGMTWVVRDLCLFAPLTAGVGVEYFSKAMVEYLDLYMQEIKGLRNPTVGSEILGVGVQIQPMPWGDKDYWAIDINLTIKEIL